MKRERIEYMDDLPMNAIGCIEMLQKVFKETTFSSKIPSVFLEEYNNAKEILCSQKT